MRCWERTKATRAQRKEVATTAEQYRAKQQYQVPVPQPIGDSSCVGGAQSPPYPLISPPVAIASLSIHFGSCDKGFVFEKSAIMSEARIVYHPSTEDSDTVHEKPLLLLRWSWMNRVHEPPVHASAVPRMRSSNFRN